MEPSKTGLKVIVAGLPRTGTMSLKAALEELGFGPCHHLLEPACQISRLRRSAQILGLPAGEKRKRALRKLFDGYEVCLDIPGSACVDDLISLYPDAKVILTTRINSKLWLESYESVFQTLQSTWFRSIGYWVPGAYSCGVMMLNWRRVYEVRFPKITAPSLEMYDKHSQFIRAITPASKLLELEVGTNMKWAPLCEFLNCLVPDSPFPRRNERSYLLNVNRLTFVCGFASWAFVFWLSLHSGPILRFVWQHGYLLSILVNQAALVSTVAYVRSRLLQSFSLTFVAVIFCTSIVKANTLTSNGIVNAVVLSCLCIQFLRAVEIFLLDPEESLPSSFIEAFNTIWNMREIGTSRQIPRIPHFRNSDSSYVPSRPRFLLRHTMTFLISYLVLEVLSMSPPIDFGAEIEKPLLEIVLTRILGTAAFWVNIILFLSLIYDILCMVQVSLYLSEPSSWPPLFNDFSQARSIRRFWGITWHQTLRKTLNSQATLILSILRVPSLGIVSRYLRLGIVFMFSGVLHWIADRTIGVPWSESGALHFFILQALGILFEDTVQVINRRIGLVTSYTAKRCCGHLWLCLFMIFTTPIWMYPTARHIRPGQDVMLPMRIF